jgi:hypothetical protein
MAIDLFSIHAGKARVIVLASKHQIRHQLSENVECMTVGIGQPTMTGRWSRWVIVVTMVLMIPFACEKEKERENEK